MVAGSVAWLSISKARLATRRDAGLQNAPGFRIISFSGYFGVVADEPRECVVGVTAIRAAAHLEIFTRDLGVRCRYRNGRAIIFVMMLFSQHALRLRNPTKHEHLVCSDFRLKARDR